jgi:hypothetical protein
MIAIVLRRGGIFLLVALTSWSVGRQARACASCGCGDPTLTGAGTEQPFRNRLRFSAAAQYRRDTLGVDAAEMRLGEGRVEGQVAWAPVERLFLVAGAPLLWRDIGYSNGEQRTSRGIGDAEVRAKVFVYRDRAFAPRHLVALVGGLKLPTAPMQRTPTGRPLPLELQPGTGSLDPIAGASYAIFAYPWSAYASTQLLWSTWGRNRSRASRSLRSTLAIQRQGGALFAARLSADTRLDGRAIEAGAPSNDSGGAIVFASPELLFSPVTDLTLSVYARVATVNWLHGRHVEPFMLGVTAAFDF